MINNNLNGVLFLLFSKKKKRKFWLPYFKIQIIFAKQILIF